MMDAAMEALIAGLLDKANDVLDGILARQECRAPVAVIGEGDRAYVLCDDGTVWEYVDNEWVESCQPLPGSVADTYEPEDENGGPHRKADDA